MLSEGSQKNQAKSCVNYVLFKPVSNISLHAKGGKINKITHIESYILIRKAIQT